MTASKRYNYLHRHCCSRREIGKSWCDDHLRRNLVKDFVFKHDIFSGLVQFLYYCMYSSSFQFQLSLAGISRRGVACDVP